MTPLHVCFVCSGNICRSPYAEGLLRHEAQARGWGEQLRATSAGTLGIVDSPAHDRMRTEAQSRGFDLEEHRSAGISGKHLATCDYIFGLAERHVVELRELFPELAERIYLLGAFPAHTTDDGEIADPIGKGEMEFMECFEEIHAALEPVLAALAERLPARTEGDSG